MKGVISILGRQTSHLQVIQGLIWLAAAIIWCACLGGIPAERWDAIASQVFWIGGIMAAALYAGGFAASVPIPKNLSKQLPSSITTIYFRCLRWTIGMNIAAWSLPGRLMLLTPSCLQTIGTPKLHALLAHEDHHQRWWHSEILVIAAVFVWVALAEIPSHSFTAAAISGWMILCGIRQTMEYHADTSAVRTVGMSATATLIREAPFESLNFPHSPLKTSVYLLIGSCVPSPPARLRLANIQHQQQKRR